MKKLIILLTTITFGLSAQKTEWQSVGKKIKEKNAVEVTQFAKNFSSLLAIPKAANNMVISQPANDVKFFEKLPKPDRERIIEAALSNARNYKSQLSSRLEETDHKLNNINRHLIEWHKKFTLSFACLLLFFVGAPLGAIIRKGGIGMPMVVSVCFFLVFHVLSIMGEKFSKEGVLPPYEGMWIASMILLPIGVFLTRKATSDSALFDINAYLKVFKLFSRKDKNENTATVQ